MLIVTRRIDEVVVIGDDITAKVLQIRGNQVRIGIQAPDHLSIDREEIYEAKRRQKNPREGR